MIDVYVGVHRDGVTSEKFGIRRNGEIGELVLEILGIFDEGGDEVSEAL